MEEGDLLGDPTAVCMRDASPYECGEKLSDGVFADFGGVGRGMVMGELVARGCEYSEWLRLTSCMSDELLRVGVASRLREGRCM
jgi:hypothetical protein